MVSAMVLPSGAARAFAVTEQDPPFLSLVATVKSSEYFAVFSKEPPTIWNAPALERLKVGVQVSPLIVRRHISEGRAAGAIAQNQRARGRAGRSRRARVIEGATDDMRDGVRVGGVRLGLAGSVHEHAVRGGSGRAVQLAGGVDDRRLRNGPGPLFTGRFVRFVVRLVTSDSAWVWVRRSPASSVSHAGSADSDPVPVCRRNFRFAVVFPAKRAQAGVPFAAIRSPRTGAAVTVSGCVAESRLWVVAPPATATVTFTRSLPESSATVRVMLAPSIRFNARRVPMAAPAFWIVNGSAPETMSVATCVCAGRSPETNVVPPVTRPLASTVTFGCVPATTPVAANEATPAATASPPTGSTWTMPLLVVVASG